MKTSVDRVSYYQELLSNSSYFKLVCGAGNEDANEVKQLTYIYTLAGCNGFDVSASPRIVTACMEGIDNAIKISNRIFSPITNRPIITVSVGMPGDHHVRKAFITDSCIKCNLCIPSCPTDAITNSLDILENLCIGCGNCESACPSSINAINYKHDFKELKQVLPQCVLAGAESIELHAGVPNDETTLEEWLTVCDSLPHGMLSMCLDRYHMSNVHLLERIQMAHKYAGERLIIQADGIPISGSKNDFNSTLQAISIADIINKELKLKDRKFRKLPILISGGTNMHTGNLARQFKVPFSGIAIGTHARKIVKEHLSSIVIGEENVALHHAVNAANELIENNLRGIKNNQNKPNNSLLELFE